MHLGTHTATRTSWGYKPGSIRVRRLLSGKYVVVSEAGDFSILSSDELQLLKRNPAALTVARQAELFSKFILKRENSRGMKRLLKSRVAARNSAVTNGPSLIIIVPTLRCEHSCRYCQVSRANELSGFSMSDENLKKACQFILGLPGKSLKVEFQGGDPLLRFDLIKAVLSMLSKGARDCKKHIEFVIASTLHQLTPEICEELKTASAVLSTSIDGPPLLHNKNRPIPGRDSYQRTIKGIALARECIGADGVAALMTTTRDSLRYPEDIVDEYVRLGFKEISIRPLSPFGFAGRLKDFLSVSNDEFRTFYQRAFARVLAWNERGVDLREGQAAIVLNKLLSSFDAGYMDLQAIPGPGNGVLVLNYDGFVYPSDESRMLAETGDASFRMGRIGDSLESLLASNAQKSINQFGTASNVAECMQCAYGQFCAHDPVMAKAECGRVDVSPLSTGHCQRSLWLFDFMLEQLSAADSERISTFRRWARTPP